MKIFALYATTAIPVLMILLLLVPKVSYAGGARMDWPDVYGEAGEEGDRAAECWVDGYDDGLDHPFNVDRHKQFQFDFGYPDADNFTNVL